MLGARVIGRRGLIGGGQTCQRHCCSSLGGGGRDAHRGTQTGGAQGPESEDGVGRRLLGVRIGLAPARPRLWAGGAWIWGEVGNEGCLFRKGHGASSGNGRADGAEQAGMLLLVVRIFVRAFPLFSFSFSFSFLFSPVSRAWAPGCGCVARQE